MAEIYTAADVFVNPTLEEVMGLTNVEALACGTPVITFDTGGSVECIDKNTGYVVEKGNLDHLIQAIESLKRDVDRAKSSKARARNLFNKNDRFEEYIQLYIAYILS